jgi:predicted secreted Zn-dependent protease
MTLVSLDDINNSEIVFYKVKGKTRKEILKSMEKNTPVVKKFFGQTVRTWNYKCNNLTYSNKVTMPKWDDKNASDEVKEYWEKFYNALILHEQGHVDITINEFNKAIDLAKNKSCKEAESIFKKSISEIERLQTEYDKETDHGINQGAVFGYTDASDYYHAISFSQNTGKFGYAKNYDSREEAEKLATRYCESNDCIIAAWSKNACVSLATSPRNSYGGAWGISAKDSEKKAIELCSNYDKECRIIKTICK